MSVTIIRGDARTLPLADDSVDLIVTSPPYFGLRSYTDGGVHYEGQVGAEATPAEFVDALIDCTREWMRVLKPSGSLWVNLGDKYAAGPMRPQGVTGQRASRSQAKTYADNGLIDTVATKSLYGIPWRFALRCIDDLGLILRAEVIWAKPNGLPESVTDRVRRSHEQWFHFVAQPRYFSAVDEIREPASDYTRATTADRGRRDSTTKGRSMLDTCNPLGKLPGSVWTVPTEPLRVPDSLGVDHFAAFPTEWPKRIIQGWSPSGVCVACGEGRRPVASTDPGLKERDTPAYTTSGVSGSGRHGRGLSTLGSRGPSATITGYTCACPDTTADTRPSVIVDPFGGTGTTAHVAHALGRHGISVDLSADYCRLAADPTVLDNRVRKVLGVEKPPPVMDGQGDLFDAAGGDAA